MTINDVQQELATFAAERDWDRFHTAKNLTMALTGEVGEPYRTLSVVDGGGVR